MGFRVFKSGFDVVTCRPPFADGDNLIPWQLHYAQAHVNAPGLLITLLPVEELEDADFQLLNSGLRLVKQEKQLFTNAGLLHGVKGTKGQGETEMAITVWARDKEDGGQGQVEVPTSSPVNSPAK